MNDQSIADLRLDRRLHGRRGWIAEQELQGELDALPDVSDKIKPPDGDEPSAQAEAPAGSAPESAAVAAGPSALPEGGGA